MAAIVITVPSSGIATNPTDLYMPFNRNGIFEDSPLNIQSVYEVYCTNGVGGSIQGLSIDNRIPTQQYQFGDIDNVNLGTVMVLDPIAGTIGFGGTNLTAATAGIPNGYFKITINGNPYKIQLLNP